jgi:NTE family protein
VLAGGGARGAYQAGVLSALAKRHPNLRIPVMAGVSAGAINTAFLGNHEGSFAEATERLSDLWRNLRTDKVIRVQPGRLVGSALRWGIRLGAGGVLPPPEQGGGMVDPAPLRATLSALLGAHPETAILQGLERRLESGDVQSLAITTTSYATGHAVTWVGGKCKEWHQGVRLQRPSRITLDHVLASSAIPLFFPAVRLADGWHGDGGIRQTAPLSPAVHLGADKILAISPRRNRALVKLDPAHAERYPPPAQIVGILMNAIFLDMLDHDAERLERLNSLIDRVPPEERNGLRPIKLFNIRPTADLGKLASEFERELPRGFRYLTRGWGTKQSQGSDALAMLLFEAEYTRRLVEIGEADGEARLDEFSQFLAA